MEEDRIMQLIRRLQRVGSGQTCALEAVLQYERKEDLLRDLAELQAFYKRYRTQIRTNQNG